MKLGRHQYAFTAASTYLLVTCLWIYFSSHVIMRMAAGDIEKLAQLQRYKGFFFMAFSAVVFYLSIIAVMKRTAKDAHRLHQAQESWLEAERQAAPALLASCIAHDVANLLTVIRLNVERMKRTEMSGDLLRETLAKLEQGTDRLMELVKRLRGASSTLFHDEPIVFNFKQNVQETLELMESHVCCESTSIDFAGEEEADLVGYPVLVHQLVMNLLINAAEATDRKGRIRFEVLRSDDGVSLIAEDNGPGIAPSLREKVMTAFFTTKSTGSGLGLSSARSCVDIHQGHMTIGDSDLGGAKFTIHLPNLTHDRVEELRHPELLAASRVAVSVTNQLHL